jgi:hypothetical protein
MNEGEILNQNLSMKTEGERTKRLFKVYKGKL